MKSYKIGISAAVIAGVLAACTTEEEVGPQDRVASIQQRVIVEACTAPLLTRWCFQTIPSPTCAEMGCDESLGLGWGCNMSRPYCDDQTLSQYYCCPRGTSGVWLAADERWACEGTPLACPQ